MRRDAGVLNSGEFPTEAAQKTSIKVTLVSQDRDLYNLCRDVLAGLPGASCSVSATSPENVGNESDLYLWDFSGDSLPDCVRWNPSKHLFLVNRHEAAAFRAKAGGEGVSVLLKPVTRATLVCFLGLAAVAREEGLCSERSLREDRDEILQCLIEANLKLQEYDQDRTNFLARAVHDFRAPLTAVGGYCGLLLGDPLGPLNERQKEVLRRMQLSARRLSRMASAMFQLSVGRQVKRTPDLRAGDLRESLEQALHEISPFADEKRINITANLTPPDRTLYFEAGQVEQVLINILDNACKFTPKGGSIEIRGYPFFWNRRCADSRFPMRLERRRTDSSDPNAYRVDIADSGAPIPAHYLDRIFEEYTSYAGGKDRSGGGLGLAICRMIVTQHGGRIWAENTEPGPMLSFLLPLGPAGLPQPAQGHAAEGFTYQEIA